MTDKILSELKDDAEAVIAAGRVDASAVKAEAVKVQSFWKSHTVLIGVFVSVVATLIVLHFVL